MLANANIFTQVSANWLSRSGNQIEYEYYNGIEQNNPSGNKNIKYIKHKKGDLVIYILEFIWDADDNILQIKNIGNG